MTAAQLSERLAQLSESLKTTNALITRLAKLTFQPGTEPPDSSDTVRTEIAQDIHDGLKQLEGDLELLKQEAEDLSGGAVAATHTKRRDSERDRERSRVNAQVARVGEDLRHSRGHFRRAQLTAKKASEAAKQKERELVFASLHTAPDPSSSESNNPQTDLFAGRRKEGQQQQKHLNKDEQLVNASSDVTAALRRTHNLLATELSRSRFAQETFDQSTAALAELGEHYSSLDTIFSNSRKLVGTLLSSQKSDTWYLETAFHLLLATLAWLFFRRILFGPFVKLPLFLWRIFILLSRWIILKPLWLLLTLSGIITTEPVTAASRQSTALTSSSRPPLIIQPSAKGGAPQMNMDDHKGLKAGIPAGAGGAGAKQGKDPALEGQVSEQIAQLHQQSQRETQRAEASQGTAGEGEKVKRGDGTVLQDRGDVPRNPKKKMFEADAEDAKHERRKRDEL